MKSSKYLLAALGIIAILYLGLKSPVQATGEGTITAIVEFRVSTTNGKYVPNAQILIIDNDGKILTSGRSDSTGTLRITINTKSDPRFPKQEMNIGTVTAITYAKGYNEHVVFEVPVREGSVQLVPLKEFRGGYSTRNEPTFSLGMSRFSVFSMVDVYAKKLGLKKQPPFPDDEYSPWMPD